MVGVKIVLRTIGLVFVMCMCILMNSYGSYLGESISKEFWFKETSPDGVYSIYCKKVMKASPFSKQRIEFSVSKKGEHGRQEGQIIFNNKEKELNEMNYEIIWKVKGVILIFNELGQDPISYLIEWDKAFLDFDREVKYWEDRL